MLVKCPCCKGAKQLMGPGCIYKDCKECKGKGEIKQPEFKELPKIYHDLQTLPVEDIRPTIIINNVAETDKPKKQKNKKEPK